MGRKIWEVKREQLAIDITVAALLTVFTLAGTVSAAKWEVVYEGDVLPDKAEPKWIYQAENPKGDAEVVDDGELRVYHIKAPNGNEFQVKRMANEGVTDVNKATIEAKLRIVSSPGGWTTTFGARESAGQSWVLMYPDKIQLYGKTDPGPEKNVDMTKYHIVRLTKDGLDAKVYLDGAEKPILENKCAGGGDAAIIFGNGTHGGGCDAYWDYVTYTLEDAFSPAQLASLGGAPVEPHSKLTITWSRLKTQP